MLCFHLFVIKCSQDFLEPFLQQFLKKNFQKFLLGRSSIVSSEVNPRKLVLKNYPREPKEAQMKLHQEPLNELLVESKIELLDEFPERILEGSIRGRNRKELLGEFQMEPL